MARTTPTLLVLSPGPLATPRLRWARAAGLRVALVDAAPAGRFHALADSVHGFDPLRDRAQVLALACELAEHGPLIAVPGGREHVDLACEIAGRTAPAAVASEPCPALPGAASQTPPRHTLEANGTFRADGSFVPTGLSERFHAAGSQPEFVLAPASIDAERADALFTRLEDVARDHGWIDGPVSLVQDADGQEEPLVAPLFLDDATTVCVAPLAFGRSPWQVWFASLIDAGGPFDTLPTARPTQDVAGYSTFRAPSDGTLRSVDGLDVARRSKGIAGVALVSAPGTALRAGTTEVAVIWGTARTAEELEARLQRACASLRIQTAERQIA